MKTKIISLLLTISLLVGVCVVPARAANASLDNFKTTNTYVVGQYSDVPATNTFSDNVKAGFEYGLMQGYGSTFGIGNNITRLASIIVACRINAIYTTGSNNIESTYTGTTQEKYIAYANEHGIYCTFDDYSFTATRAEFAAILASALPDSALKVKNIVDENAIPDVMSSSRFADAIYKLYRSGVIVGSDAKGTFNPESKITRGAACAIATRMIKEDLRKSITLQKTEAPVATMERNEGIYNYLCYYLYTYHNASNGDFTYTEKSGSEEWSLIYGTNSIALTDRFVSSGSVILDTTLTITNSLEPYKFEYKVYDLNNKLLTTGIVNNLLPYNLDLTYEDAYLVFSDYSSVYDNDNAKTDGELAALQLLSSLTFLDRILTAEGDGYSIYDLGFYKTYSQLDHSNIAPKEPVVAGTLTVSKNNLSISGKTTISASVDFDDDVSLNCNYDEEYVDVTWGDWNNNSINLSITPLKNGTSSLLISVIEHPEITQTITVTATGVVANSGAYTAYPETPDFGALNSVSPFVAAPLNDEATVYMYLHSALKSAGTYTMSYNLYDQELREWGYSLEAVTNDSSGKPAICRYVKYDSNNMYMVLFNPIDNYMGNDCMTVTVGVIAI